MKKGQQTFNEWNMRFLKWGSFFNYTKYFEYDEKMSQNEISIMIQIEFLLRQSQ